MNELQNRIHMQRMKLIDFAYSDSSGCTVEEIKQQILSFYDLYNVIVVNLGAESVYRVRKIDTGDAHGMASDVWHPPPDCVGKIGRANNIGEAVFYCSLDPATAIEEGQIVPGDRFSLAIYQLAGREPYNMTSVVVREARLIPSPSATHPEEFRQFGAELSKFMVREFTRHVAPGDEHLYSRSCAISSILFDLPRKDSIIYPSVKNHDAVNVVLKSDAAKERLTLVQVVTCTMDEVGNVNVEAICAPDVNGRLIPQLCPDPMPRPLTLTGSRSSFKQMFRDENIASPKEILNYYQTKKSKQTDQEGTP